MSLFKPGKSPFGMVLFLLALSSCVAHQPPNLAGGQSEVTAPAEERLSVAYQEAVEAAKYPSAAKVSRDLVALVRDTDELVWNASGQVLMVTFTKAQYYQKEDENGVMVDLYKQGQSFSLYGETWLTAAPFLKDFCSAYGGENLLLRIQQMLGLPPKTEGANDAMVSLWVDPRLIFRPCPDPEVIDHECVVSLAGGAPGADQPPWYWGAAPQLSGAFTRVGEAHMGWLYNNWNARYSPKEPMARYPWTALGYTYDWGDDSPVGMSEFVALGGTSVAFESLVLLDSYCGR